MQTPLDDQTAQLQAPQKSVLPVAPKAPATPATGQVSAGPSLPVAPPSGGPTTQPVTPPTQQPAPQQPQIAPAQTSDPMAFTAPPNPSATLTPPPPPVSDAPPNPNDPSLIQNAPATGPQTPDDWMKAYQQTTSANYDPTKDFGPEKTRADFNNVPGGMGDEAYANYLAQRNGNINNANAAFQAKRRADQTTLSNSANTGDEWWAAHGAGGPNENYIPNSDTTYSAFTNSYQPGGPGSTPALDAAYQAEQARLKQINSAPTWSGAPAGTKQVNGAPIPTPGPTPTSTTTTPTTPTTTTTPPTNTTPPVVAPGPPQPSPTPSGPPTTLPVAQPSSGPPPAGQMTTQSPGGPVSTTPTLTPLTPDNALTNSIISPNSNVNRFDVANQQLKDTISNTLEPQFNADARTIAAQSFGAGRGVSGENRTSEGNLELQHERDMNQLTSNFLNPALTGTIQDTLNNANFEAGQQQFEAGQQNTAFGQNYAIQQLMDAENSQQFNQALQQLLAGSSGDPSSIQLILAQLFGGQSAQSAQAATNLAHSTG